MVASDLAAFADMAAIWSVAVIALWIYELCRPSPALAAHTKASLQRGRVARAMRRWRRVWHSVDTTPDPDECTLCLEPYAAGQTLTTLPCGHQFHASCIETWLIHPQSRTCPLCRAHPFRPETAA